MKLSVEHDVFDDHTAAISVDGVRIVYIKPMGGVDQTVEIVVLNYNEFGLTPISQPRFRSHVGAVKRRTGRGRRTRAQRQAEETVA